MDLLTPEIARKIERGIISRMVQEQYFDASRSISGILAELYASIPAGKRISYGIVHTIKVLSEYLYARLAEMDAPVYQLASALYEESDDYKSKCVALGMLSFYGLEALERTFGYFESAAASPDWQVREIAQMLFRKLIAKHPDDAHAFLLKLVMSPDANVRRFVSETLRPVQENQWFYKNPEYPLSILRNLYQERSPYPRTSVGNNLSDLARRLPDLIYALVGELVDSGDPNSYWIAYRACRNLVKADPVRVRNLLRVDEYRYKKRVYRAVDLRG